MNVIDYLLNNADRIGAAIFFLVVMGAFAKNLWGRS